MAIVQISRIQHRRGLQQDLPQLSGAELGWSVDSRRLFIGNGTTEEGAPTLGYTEILTEYSDVLSAAEFYTFKGLSSGSIVETGPDSLHPIVRTLQDKLDDIVSVKDFGAIGDGNADDTAAIQRAVTRVYGSAQSTTQSNQHRTIYFPAGVYRITDTINVPPFSRLQGEGKRTSEITGTFDGPLIQFADGFGQVGYDFGAPNGTDEYPEIAEYHFSDISFKHGSPTFDQSCVLIDGAYSASFFRCMFRGLTDNVTANGVLNGYDIDRGTGVAGVCMTNSSAYTSVKNLQFMFCDFMDINYGIQMDGEIIGVTVGSCYFDHEYHNIAIGLYSDDTYFPNGITIDDNYFRYSAYEAVNCGVNSKHIMSMGNLFTAAGLADYAADVPIINPTGVAQAPAINFRSNNNQSIADSLYRNAEDLALFPNVETNGYDCYIIGQDLGTVDGRLTTGTGRTITLDVAPTMITAGVYYIPDNYSNLTMTYTLTNNDEQRSGVLKITKVGTTYSVDEEYNETGTTGVEFQVNTTTGDIEYTAIDGGSPPVLTYSLQFLTPSTI